MKICPVCAAEYGDDVRFCKNDGSGLRALGATTDLVGQVLAERYHILRKLGEGGMGEVYLAEHIKMGRRSAIKIMSPAMVHDPDAVARFNREAANASRITHPNVCAIYDFGETTDGLIYLAMEFVEGEPLTELLEREGALPVDRAGRIFLQAADALQTAHDLGIVHRDLKPDNIMLGRTRAGDDLVKVVDFGIAKAVGGEANQKVTKTGLVVGTPEFMSPEQLSGDALDGRSDLYSLALVLFRMLTSTLPFEAETVQEIMVKRLTDDPMTLAAARPGLEVPPGLQSCLDTALARTPVDRYRSVAKFAGDVAQVLGFAPAAPVAHVPATRASDDHGPTALFGARGAATPRTPPALDAPARRRGAPVLIGAIALLGVGAAVFVALGRGASPVAPAADGAPPPTDAVTAAPSDEQEVARSTTPPAPPPRRVEASIAPGGAGAALDALFDAIADTGLRPAATLRMARDSAQRLFEAPEVATDDRAFAAYVVANAFAALDDRSGACDWARRARRMNADVSAYGALERALCGV